MVLLEEVVAEKNEVPEPILKSSYLKECQSKVRMYLYEKKEDWLGNLCMELIKLLTIGKYVVGKVSHLTFQE